MVKIAGTVSVMAVDELLWCLSGDIQSKISTTHSTMVWQQTENQKAWRYIPIAHHVAVGSVKLIFLYQLRYFSS